MSGCRHVAQSKIWWLFGGLSLAGLYYLPTYQGYSGLLKNKHFSCWKVGACILYVIFMSCFQLAWCWLFTQCLFGQKWPTEPADVPLEGRLWSP